MKRFVWAILVTAICSSTFAGVPPLAKLRKYSGTFVWIKVGTPPASSIKSFAKAKAFVIDVNLSKDVTLNKDANGNQWFTFIVADQGSDWKWSQTKGNGPLKVIGGKIKAGNYKVIVPTAGIPASVLASKMQSISIGPGTSGIAGKLGSLDVTINNIKGQ